MLKENIDFLVIGAQKSGTTSLFKYLQHHPELYLPPQKEVNFFVNANKFPRGIEWYIQTYFSGADEDKLWGEVCPAYMGYSAAPAHIHAVCPNAKLVAILRNPIDRAYSHYRMVVRRGTESRPFRRVIEERLSSHVEVPQTKVVSADDSPFLLEFSLYGKSLERYLRYFEREQLLVLFQEDLAAHPEKLLKELFSFLGVDHTYRPANLGRKYHMGGDKRLPWLDEWLRGRKLLKKVIRKTLVSKRNIETARFWFSQANIKPVRSEGPSLEDRRFLREALEDDVALLKGLFSVDTPWPEFENSGVMRPRF